MIRIWCIGKTTKKSIISPMKEVGDNAKPKVAQLNRSDPSLDQTSLMEAELDRLLQWIQGAESRLAFVLTLSTAMLGSLAVLAPSASDWTLSAIIATSIAALFLVLSILFVALASFPRTTGPKYSIIYFGTIASQTLEQYESTVGSLTPERYQNDLIGQCHRNATIVARKYYWVQRSMVCLLLSSLPWAVSLFILYFERH